MPKKILTPQQAETAKQRAAAFLRNVLDDDDRADEVDRQCLGEWMEQTGRTIRNPTQGVTAMAKSKADLEQELSDANEYIEELEAKLDRVASAIDDGDDSDDSDDSDLDSEDELEDE